MADELNPKQQRFVEEYLVDRNGTQAAIRAGYSPKTANVQASDLLAKPNIAAAVAEGSAKLSEKTGLDAQWVLDGLKKNYLRAMQEEPVLDREGNPTGEYVYQGAVANRSLELVGKHIGMFVDKTEIEIKKRVAGMTPDELTIKAAAILAKKKGRG
jgi:phage terminase small subunit